MKLRKLYALRRKFKPNRKDFRFSYKPEFFIDTESYIFLLIPSISFQPWFMLMPNVQDHIFQLSWLNMGIGIGRIYDVK